MCESVCLFHLRYLEQKVVSPHCLHHLEELCLASCTNCFLSLHEVLFERKWRWKVFTSYAPIPVYAPLHFRLSWAGLILPTATKPLEYSRRVCIEEHALHITGTIVAIAFIRLVPRRSSGYVHQAERMPSKNCNTHVCNYNKFFINIHHNCVHYA